MITPKIGQAMAMATTRHNNARSQKLVVFYKALELIQTEETWESKVVFAGTLDGKQAEVTLLNEAGQITLNLTIEEKTFESLRMTEVVNENDYLAWNLRVREAMATPQEQEQLVSIPVVSRTNEITNPKLVNKKAKTHDVTPLDNDFFRVRSGSSRNEYLVRLLPNEDGATCDCAWGQHRRYADNHKSGCSHVQAVYQQLEGHRNRTISAWSTKEDAYRQHRPMANIGDNVILTLRKL